MKRIILTSSWTAIIDWSINREANETHTREASANIPVYERSKILAEKKAWEMIKNQSTENKLEMVTLHPSKVIGRPLFKTDAAAIKFGLDIMIGELPILPWVYYSFVDVEDVAKAHLLAVKAQSGERYIISGENYKMLDVGKIISSEFK